MCGKNIDLYEVKFDQLNNGYGEEGLIKLSDESFFILKSKYYKDTLWF